MKVVLRKDVEHVGRAGDVKNVAPGFARNYLMARGLAAEATPGVLRWFEKGQEKRAKLHEAAASAAREVATKLTGTALAFTRPAGEEGKIFGSVGKSDIAKSLKDAGFAVDKTAVRLEAAIKQTGDYEVEVKLHHDVAAKIKVSVLPRQ